MDTAQFLRNDFDQIVAAVAAGVAEHVDGFNVGIEDPHHPLRRLRQRTLRLSLSGMADEIDARHGTPPPVPMDWSAHWELGRMECRSGRPLSEILQAPWAASRTIFHHCVRRADDAGLTALDLQEIADVVIDWSDRISVAFSDGYDDEGTARAGQIETRRQRLLE